MAEQKIVIIGNEGAGKSTLATRLATQLGVPHIEVESVSSLQLALPPPPGGWVVEGMRRMSLRDDAIPAADLLIWLDIGRLRIGTMLVSKALVHRLRSSRVDGMRSQTSLRSEMRTAMRSMRRHRVRRKRYQRMYDQAAALGLDVVRVRTPRAARKVPKQLSA
jgi:cytidylate kinase